MSSDAQRFNQISQDVKDGKMTVEAAVSELGSINFLLFNIDEIAAVQEASWLPDEVAVDIMKKWMRQQDTLLLELRAHLVLTPELTKERLQEFTQAIACPSNEPNIVIKNVIYSLATAGGTRPPVNPLKCGLISCTWASEISEHKVEDIFSFDSSSQGKYYMSNAAQGQFLTISLPPFLRLQLTEYTLGAPPKDPQKKAEGGINSWQLQGSNDLKNFQVTLDLQSENKDLKAPNSEHTFVIDEPEKKEFFRHFKLVQTGQNHQGNLSLYLSKFDLSGKLIIHKE